MSTQLINQVLELTNAERVKTGLNPLTLNTQLSDAAEQHSDSMAQDDFFSHTGADGSNASDRAESNGYQYSTLGENIAAGQKTAEQVVQGWMDSPGHRANILNADYTEIGIGYEYLENDTGSVNYNHYWTQVFGTPLNNNSGSNSNQNDSPVEEPNDVPQDNIEPDNSNFEPIEEAVDIVPEDSNNVEEPNDASEENVKPDNYNFEPIEEAVDIVPEDSNNVEETNELPDWNSGEFNLPEDGTQDYVTGNYNDSVMTGGENSYDFDINIESTEGNDFSANEWQQLTDVLDSSCLGSLMESVNDYEEMGLENTHSFLEQYQDCMTQNNELTDL